MKPPMNANSHRWILRELASIGVHRRSLAAGRYKGRPKRKGRGMDRRTFIQLLAAAPIPSITDAQTLPTYRVATTYSPASLPGMPGPYPGQVVSVKSARCLNESSNTVDT